MLYKHLSFLALYWFVPYCKVRFSAFFHQEKNLQYRPRTQLIWVLNPIQKAISDLPCVSISKRVYVRNHTGPFLCKWNSFSFEWFRTYSRFETEAMGNKEIAYKVHCSALQRITVRYIQLQCSAIILESSDRFSFFRSRMTTRWYKKTSSQMRTSAHR